MSDNRDEHNTGGYTAYSLFLILILLLLSQDILFRIRRQIMKSRKSETAAREEKKVTDKEKVKKVEKRKTVRRKPRRKKAIHKDAENKEDEKKAEEKPGRGPAILPMKEEKTPEKQEKAEAEDVSE